MGGCFTSGESKMALKVFNGGRYAAIILPNGFEKSSFKLFEGQDLEM